MDWTRRVTRIAPTSRNSSWGERFKSCDAMRCSAVARTNPWRQTGQVAVGAALANARCASSSHLPQLCLDGVWRLERRRMGQSGKARSKDPTTRPTKQQAWSLKAPKERVLRCFDAAQAFKIAAPALCLNARVPGGCTAATTMRSSPKVTSYGGVQGTKERVLPTRMIARA